MPVQVAFTCELCRMQHQMPVHVENRILPRYQMPQGWSYLAIPTCLREVAGDGQGWDLERVWALLCPSCVAYVRACVREVSLIFREAMRRHLRTLDGQSLVPDLEEVPHGKEA